VRIDKKRARADVFIVQPTNAPRDMMELLLLIDAAKRAHRAARVTAVVPYFGYGGRTARISPGGDRGEADGEPDGGGRDRSGGLDRLPPAPDPGGSSTSRWTICTRRRSFTRYFREKGLTDLVVVAPGRRARRRWRGAISKRLGATFAIIDKRRPAPTRPR
jgi:ribose-phosphate pyrophosphokinase